MRDYERGEAWLSSSLKRHGFWTALVVTLVSAALLELSGLWPTMLLAGFLGGLLARRLIKGTFAGFFGTVIAWGLYLAAFWLISPQSLTVAFELAPVFFLLTVAFGGVLGGLGGALGALFVMTLFPPREGK